MYYFENNGKLRDENGNSLNSTNFWNTDWNNGDIYETKKQFHHIKVQSKTTDNRIPTVIFIVASTFLVFYVILLLFSVCFKYFKGEVRDFRARRNATRLINESCKILF